MLMCWMMCLELMCTWNMKVCFIPTNSKGIDSAWTVGLITSYHLPLEDRILLSAKDVSIQILCILASRNYIVNNEQD